VGKVFREGKESGRSNCTSGQLSVIETKHGRGEGETKDTLKILREKCDQTILMVERKMKKKERDLQITRINYSRNLGTAHTNTRGRK